MVTETPPQAGWELTQLAHGTPLRVQEPDDEEYMFTPLLMQLGLPAPQHAAPQEDWDVH